MAEGADEFVRFSQDMLATMEATHMLGQVQISMHGETASGECYFQSWHGTRDAGGRAGDLFIAGRYIDEYAWKVGEWRISRRTLITDWITDNPANHSFYAANPTTNRGDCRGKDFSETITQG